jgi:hypothetical protein
MPFEKGKTGNPNGRPRGAVSEKTKLWEELGHYIVEGGAQRAMVALQSLEDDEFLDKYMTMLEYFKPKQARISHMGEQDTSPINIIIQDGL